MPGHAVGAEQANNRGDACGNECRQANLWRAGVRARLAAATDQMHMLVDKPRANHRSSQIAFRAVWPRCSVVRFFDRHDFSRSDQQIATSLILRGVEMCVAEKVGFQH